MAFGFIDTVVGCETHMKLMKYVESMCPANEIWNFSALQASITEAHFEKYVWTSREHKTPHWPVKQETKRNGEMLQTSGPYAM